MKVICLIIVLNIFAFSQDTTPFDIIGNQTINLPTNFLEKGMNGYALIYLLIDKNCNLMKHALYRINISDQKNENSIIYNNKILFDEILKKDSQIYNHEFYPTYIRDIIKVIEKKLKEIKIICTDTKDLSESNQIMYKIFIE